MVLERSPWVVTQAHPTPTLERSPYIQNTDQLLRYYIITCRADGKTKSTIKTYEGRLSQFLYFTKGDFSPQNIRLFLLSLQDRPLDPTTIHAFYRAIKAFFNTMVREGIIESSPMANIKPPRVPQKKVRAFSTIDLKNMMHHTQGNKFLDLRNRAMMLLFLDTGIRLAEMAGIRLGDLNIEGRAARIMGKGNKERIVPFGEAAQKALLRYLIERGVEPGALWLSEERRPLTRCGVRIMVVTLCGRAGVTDAKPGPHTFRHTAASLYLKNGGDMATLRALLGHSSIETTMLYLRSLGDEDVALAHRKYSPVDNMKF